MNSHRILARWDQFALWFVMRFLPRTAEEIFTRGFDAGEEHALMCRGGPELYVVAEPQEGSQWGVGSAGNA